MNEDRTLLLRTHKGHEASARLLWDRHAPAMLALAGAIVRQYGLLGEDVVQIAFCRVMQADRRSLRRVQDVRGWLCQVTRRVALNEIRRERRERDRRVGAASESGATPSEADEAAVLVSRLPRRLREVVILKHVGELTFDQIALALDVPRSTAASRYQAALDRLRREANVEVACG